jgi:CelD/BcsL family acetyltransferase involved in cellulose biosynthesis
MSLVQTAPPVAAAVLEVEWIEDEDSFRGLAADWEALAAELEEPTPFDLHCWYLEIWGAFFRGHSQPAICTVRRDRQLVAVFPLVSRGHRLDAMANIHSCVFRPLVADDEAAAAVLREVTRRPTTGLQLAGVPIDGGWPGRLGDAATDFSRITVVESSYSSPYIDTTGDLEEWRKANKKRWKAPLEKKRRKMGRDHEAEFAIAVAPKDLDAELEDGLKIEGSGWKGENGTAILSKPETAAFYRAAARVFYARDELRFSRIALDGETIAFDFALLHGGRLYSLKVGYDEKFRSLAPALVMRLSMIERCFELGLRTHELLGDDAPWKSQFASGFRDHVGFFAYSRGLGGRALYVYRAKLRPALRRSYRRLRPHVGSRQA